MYASIPKRESLCAPILRLAGLLLYDDVPVAPELLDSVENTITTVILDEAAFGNQVLGTICDPAIAVEHQILSVLPYGGISLSHKIH